MGVDGRTGPFKGDDAHDVGGLSPLIELPLDEGDGELDLDSEIDGLSLVGDVDRDEQASSFGVDPAAARR